MLMNDHPKSQGDDFADISGIPVLWTGSVQNPEILATHFGHHHEQYDIDERALFQQAEYSRLRLNIME